MRNLIFTSERPIASGGYPGGPGGAGPPPPPKIFFQKVAFLGFFWPKKAIFPQKRPFSPNFRQNSTIGPPKFLRIAATAYSLRSAVGSASVS